MQSMNILGRSTGLLLVALVFAVAAPAVAQSGAVIVTVTGVDQDAGEVGPRRIFVGMQHGPPLAIETVPAQLGERGRAPHLGLHAEAAAQFDHGAGGVREIARGQRGGGDQRPCDVDVFHT